MVADSANVTEGGAREKGDAESAVEMLLRVAGSADYFRSSDGGVHARVPVGNRHETYRLKSLEFTDWLIESYRRERLDLPPSVAVARVVRAVEARARLDGGTRLSHVRVGRGVDGDGGERESYIDLGDSSGQAVRICAREWSVVDRPPVHFRRPAGLLSLPFPTRGGSIELLRR